MSGKSLLSPGQQYGLLTTVENMGAKNGGWLCKCECGNTKVVQGCTLRAGLTKTCGVCRKHGMSESKTYNSWLGMLQRCYNVKQPTYLVYGARGVTVCDRWNPKAGGSFHNFLADMGERPNGTNLDKDKRGGIGCLLYSPENCCWLNPSEQAKYRRRSNYHRMIKETEFQGAVHEAWLG